MVKSVETTKLSSKGQVIIPKHIREAHHWEAGLELDVIEHNDGILLKPRRPFDTSHINDVAGSLSAGVRRKSEKDIQDAMKRAARKAWRDNR